MAPMPPLGRKRLLAELAAGRVPLAFGAPHPTVAVVQQDGVFRLRELVVDTAEAMAASQAALAARRSWTPEQHYGLGKPEGRVVLEAPTLPELCEKIAAHEPWPADW